MAVTDNANARTTEYDVAFDGDWSSAFNTANSGNHRRSGCSLKYVSCEARVPEDHPLRAIRAVADEVLEVLSPQLAELSSCSITTEKLLRSLLLERLYSIRSERQLIEQLGYNLLFRWFVGLPIDAQEWDVIAYTKSRERLLASSVTAQFLAAVLGQPRVTLLLSSERLSLESRLRGASTLSKSLNPRVVEEPLTSARDVEDDLYGENGEKLPYYPARPRQQYP